LIGFAKITRDITERHTTQKALEQVQQQLAQSQKMEALGQLTGGVAHDFNNLLTVVFGNLRRVKRLLQDDAKGLAAAEAIEIAAKRGATLTRQLLTFARHQSLSPTVIELGERIASIRTMMAGAMGSPYKLSSFAPPDTWKIYADPSELELAIVNLMLNARDAMPRGGEIVIAAENLVLKPGDTAAQLEGEFVAVTVADMGQGIPADLLPRVFDPFFTTKGREKGTGLGLSQVHGFAHQSGGTVKIDTELGQGTCVTLYLPRAPAEPIAAATKRDDQAAVAGERVLLIEDNPAVLDVTKMQLEEIGCDVVAVTDAESGLERATAERFDLVLSDIVMAGPMNGIELARRLRDVQPGLPVLLATGYNEQAAQIADEFIVLRKPYDSADLTRAIARVLARAEKVDPEKVVDLGAAKRQRRKDALPH
jgi:nitrogen-specific signal transduction histidine kinase/ActR/RegA family two-component response regulator